MNCAELQDLLGGFALDSLEPGQEARVRQHLRGCASCRATADALRAAAMMVGEGVAEATPPTELRSRIMARVHAEAVPRRTPVRTGDAQGRARSWKSRHPSPWVATAAAALIALSAGGWALSEHFSRPGQPSGVTAVKLNPLDRLIASGNSTVITLAASQRSGAHGALVTDPRTDATYFLLSGVPALHRQEVYTLWYMALEDGSLTPVRIGEMKHPGAYRISRGPAGFTQVALSREPRTGDATPKGPVLLAAHLS
ncbi:MAG: anti-sigma factor domain-containing protein [Candidatus Dormibacteria bacterium]